MRVMCVDDEPGVLKEVERELQKIEEVTDTVSFLSFEKALKYVENEGVDVALLDINLGYADGLSLARRIKEQSPHTHIIFLTGYSQYAVDAFRLHASGYLLKPVTCEEIREEFQYICNLSPRIGQKRLMVRCFGNFEVFVDGLPLKFERSRTKELFAYLIDRKGAAVSTGELCAVLWEERPDCISLRNQLRVLLSDLSRNLRRVHAEKAFIKERNFFAVAVDEISCDYYDFLNGKAEAVNSYFGEYMSQYAWAEMTLGFLQER